VNEAILMLMAHLFNNRESVLVGVTAQELPFGLLDMLSDYRAWLRLTCGTIHPSAWLRLPTCWR